MPRPVVTQRPVTRQATRREPLAERLERAWRFGRIAPVLDRELPSAIDTLFDYHLRVDFFGVRTKGMERFYGFGPEGTVEVALAPHRLKVPITRNDGSANDTCGLCEPIFESERGLAWRTWRIWPNAFPYVPPESQHLLLTSSRHARQHYSPAILGDMLDFQASAAGGRPLTFHYNGIAGNSQVHLHWQATRETLPLQRQLDSGRLELTPIVASRSGRVETFDRGFYAGILVSGSKSFLMRRATQIIERLDRDPLTRGAYNLLILGPRAGEQRLVIIGRRADHLRPTIGSLGPRGVGAFNAGGILVLPKPAIPDDFAESITPAMRATIVPPNELPWLAQLAREPDAILPSPASVG